MKTRLKLGMLAAGLALVFGAGIIALTSDNGKKIRRKIKRMAEDFFDEADNLTAKARKKYNEMEQRVHARENKATE